MNQEWLEMRSKRRRRLNSSVWIPLRSSHLIERVGRYGYLGYKEEFFGVGTLAVPEAHRDEASKLGWDGAGIRRDQLPYVEDGKYLAADCYDTGEWQGTYLVLEQRVNSAETGIWHLHQDLVTGLGLIREGDHWLAMDEGYEVIARLTRNDEGRPVLLEIKAEHLKDYLVASGQALYITSYRRRRFTADNVALIDWEKDTIRESGDGWRWNGYVRAIHEGGVGYGEEMAVFHMARTDVDPEEDVPVMGPPNNDNIKSDNWKQKSSGRKLYHLSGEMWLDEWVEAGEYSSRIRGDERPSSVHFITDAAGTRVAAGELTDEGRWLWFRPDVIMAIAHKRGGKLGWYTRHTGHVRCSPDYSIHFGMNGLGLITVYAKDVAWLSRTTESGLFRKLCGGEGKEGSGFKGVKLRNRRLLCKGSVPPIGAEPPAHTFGV